MNLDNKWTFNNRFKDVVEEYYNFNEETVPDTQPTDNSIRQLIDNSIINSIINLAESEPESDENKDIIMSESDSYLKRCGC